MEIPSDNIEVVYMSLDDAGGWKQNLAQELKALGYEINSNKVITRRR